MSKSNRLALLLGVWLVGGAPLHAWAAACCSGGAAAPSIISGDDASQLSFAVARGTVIGDAPLEGTPIFRNGASSEVSESYLLSGATLVSDRWQIGASLPLVGHGISSASGSGNHSTGLGDIRANVAYEFWPEWTYSEWEPRGFSFLQLTLPTGASVYDAQSAGAAGAVDSLSSGFGKGFYSLGAGAMLVKHWSAWDAYAIPEIHRSFGRHFGSNLTFTEVGAGWGGSLSVGVGVSPGAGNFRIGLRIQPQYDSPKDAKTEASTSRTGYQVVWNTALEASYLVAAAWTLNATYTDQTLLGPAVNTSLSRTFALGFQRRWER